MKTQYLFLLAISVAILTGCGSVYQSRAKEFIASQPESAWGAAPAKSHRESERQHILAMLKDPDSAKFAYSDLQRVTIAASLTSPTVVPVWGSRVSVNAKNSFGGYVGAKDWWFYYRDAVLIAIDHPERGRTYLSPIQ